MAVMANISVLFFPHGGANFMNNNSFSLNSIEDNDMFDVSLYTMLNVITCLKTINFHCQGNKMITHINLANNYSPVGLYIHQNMLQHGRRVPSR